VGLLLALPTAWMVAFFVSSMVIVVLLSFGHTSRRHPVFGTSTANYAPCGPSLPRAVPALAALRAGDRVLSV
jgi:hypothetical protein